MSQRSPSASKSHHYVPESYLKRFSDASGFLHIRDRARGQTRRQKPKKVMKIDGYYRQSWAPPGVDINLFETELAKGPEADAKHAIDKLITTPRTLDDRDTATLLLYLELQRIRVPRQAKAALSLMREAILDFGPPDITAEIRAGKFELTMKDSARFDYIRMAIGAIHPWLARMEWEVVESQEGSFFVTSDSPVSFYNQKAPPPAEAGVGLAGTIVFFPLSSRKLLIMRHPECRTEPPLLELPIPTLNDGVIAVTHGSIWNRSLVERTNWKLAALAHELVVAESENTLRTAGWN